MEKSFHGFIGRNKKKNSTKSEEEEKRDEEEKKERIQEITRDDLKQLRKLKRRKVPEKDGIENEAWKYMSTEIGEALWKLVNNI